MKPYFLLTQTDFKRVPCGSRLPFEPREMATRWEELTVTLHFTGLGNTKKIKDKKILKKINKYLEIT